LAVVVEVGNEAVAVEEEVATEQLQELQLE
jgi:hypothetical protein